MAQNTEHDKNHERNLIPNNSQIKRRLARLILTIITIFPGLAACKNQTEQNLIYYDYTGIYDPTPNHENPYDFNGDEFYATGRAGFPKGTDPNTYTCNKSAKRSKIILIPVFRKTTIGELVPGTCRINKVE